MKAKRHTFTRPPPAAKNRPPPSTNRPPPTENRNQLLASLPASVSSQLFPTLDVIPLRLKQVLHKPGEPIRHVYFPGGGFCSLLTILEDGTMVEVATIGREGMVVYSQRRIAVRPRRSRWCRARQTSATG
jgi:hypothetical protein